jgi:hypothetical protein
MPPKPTSAAKVQPKVELKKEWRAEDFASLTIPVE